MDREMVTIVSILLVVVSSVTGILMNQVNHVQAELDKRAEIVYSIPIISAKLDHIELKIDKVNDRIDQVINRGQTGTNP